MIATEPGQDTHVSVCADMPRRRSPLITARADYADCLLCEEDLELIDMRYQEFKARIEMEELFADGVLNGT